MSESEKESAPLNAYEAFRNNALVFLSHNYHKAPAYYKSILEEYMVALQHDTFTKATLSHILHYLSLSHEDALPREIAKQQQEIRRKKLQEIPPFFRKFALSAIGEYGDNAWERVRRDFSHYAFATHLSDSIRASDLDEQQKVAHLQLIPSLMQVLYPYVEKFETYQSHTIEETDQTRLIKQINLQKEMLAKSISVDYLSKETKIEHGETKTVDLIRLANKSFPVSIQDMSDFETFLDSFQKKILQEEPTTLADEENIRLIRSVIKVLYQNDVVEYEVTLITPLQELLRRTRTRLT